MSLNQLKVMSAIESCLTAAPPRACGALRGLRPYGDRLQHCRNRHCPKWQGAPARYWMAAREAELLPVPYFHVVFTLPSAIGGIAYYNKAVIYDLLFTASAQTYPPSLPTPSISAPASASPRSCPAGDRR